MFKKLAFKQDQSKQMMNVSFQGIQVYTTSQAVNYHRILTLFAQVYPNTVCEQTFLPVYNITISNASTFKL